MNRTFVNTDATETEKALFFETGLFRVPARKPETYAYIPIEHSETSFPTKITISANQIPWDRLIILDPTTKTIAIGTGTYSERGIRLLLNRLEELSTCKTECEH